jgi:putative ABC transport system permease protein
MNPTILGVRLSMLFRFYGWRLQRHTAQELLAGSGIAVGVALVFGVLVANTNLTHSATGLVHELDGSARFALVARSAAGFDKRLAEAAGRLPGVRVAAGLLRENVTLVGAKGRQTVQLVGVSANDARLGGLSQSNVGVATLLLAGGVGISSEMADAIGVRAGQSMTVLAGSDLRGARVKAVVGDTAAGAIADSAVGATVLWRAQALTGKPGRLTQVLIEPRPGAQRLVAGELARLAAGRLDVVAADNELRLLAQATKPNAQSTALFSAISVMVGILLALNAMLLTVPERRRFVADLRVQGYDRGQVLLLLGFEALMLGLVASLIGVALGDVLFRIFFHQTPAYLANAFPIGNTQPALHLTTIVLAVACGVFATGLASLPLVFDLRSGRPADVVFRQAGGGGEVIEWRVALRLGIVGAALAAVVTVLIVIDPSLTIVGGVALALTTLCLVPLVFIGVARGLPRACEGVRSGALVVAVSELRATSTRSVALAGIAALAVYGSVAIGGARQDLIRGISGATEQYFGTADVWVTSGDDIFNTNNFATDGIQATIARIPGVASVRVYQGGLLDVGARRLWVRARPSQDPAMLESSQIVSGDLARATELIRRGGWVAISSGLADEDHLRVGESVSLPTPSGSVRFGVAAIMTNSGWPPGTITLNSDDYRRYWPTTDAAALEVSLRPGAGPVAARRTIAAALVGRPGLRVRTSAERDVENKANASQGLHTLGEISTLLLVAAALAVASALSAAVWQRRARLAALKIQGYDHRQLWRALLFESAIMLGIGSIIGATVGVYGHALASRWLKLTTGFPAPFSIGSLHVILTFALVTGIALVVVALPGLVAARVPVRASFQE